MSGTLSQRRLCRLDRGKLTPVTFSVQQSKSGGDSTWQRRVEFFNPDFPDEPLILAQYLRDKERPVYCFDTDPINATFAQYGELNAEHLNVLRRGAINERAFDSIVDKICLGEGAFVIDTGATTFVPMWNYIL